METDDAMLERPTPKDWKDVAYELRQALVLVMNGHATKDGETVREALYSFNELESFDDWLAMVIQHDIESTIQENTWGENNEGK